MTRTHSTTRCDVLVKIDGKVVQDGSIVCHGDLADRATALALGGAVERTGQRLAALPKATARRVEITIETSEGED